MIFHSSKSRLEKGWFIHWKFPYPLMHKSTRKVGFDTLFNHLCTREKSTRTSLLRKLKNTEYPFHLCKSRPEKVRAVPWRFTIAFLGKKWLYVRHNQTQSFQSMFEHIFELIVMVKTYFLFVMKYDILNECFPSVMSQEAMRPENWQIPVIKF